MAKQFEFRLEGFDTAGRDICEVVSASSPEAARVRWSMNHPGCTLKQLSRVRDKEPSNG